VIRIIIPYKDNFIEFYEKQDDKVQLKIEFVLDLVRFEERVPIKFFKLLKSTEGIYEIWVLTAFKSIRILCFLDEGNLVILTNCFVKKTQKTPKKEIKLAQKTENRIFKRKKQKKMKNITTFENILENKYGKNGTEKRDKYDMNSLAFRLGVMLKEARNEANLTQEQLAEKTGTKKSYISRIERGLSDIQISTYYKLIEIGIGKSLNISIG